LASLSVGNGERRVCRELSLLSPRRRPVVDDRAGEREPARCDTRHDESTGTRHARRLFKPSADLLKTA